MSEFINKMEKKDELLKELWRKQIKYKQMKFKNQGKQSNFQHGMNIQANFFSSEISWFFSLK